MSLGAAGCGVDTNNRCVWLQEDRAHKIYVCSKYRKELKPHRITKEPIRLEICCNEAMSK